MAAAAAAAQPRIRISPRVAVANPCMRADLLLRFDGPWDEFLAEHMGPYVKQRRNYGDLAATLEPHGIRLEHVWAGQFAGNDGGRRMTWLACDEARTVFWHKAESPGAGTGHNHVYIHGQRMKLTTWLAMPLANQLAVLRGDGE